MITYLRRGKRLLRPAAERGVGCERNNQEWDVRETTMQTPRSVKKEREEVRWSRDSPAARGETAGCPLAAHGG